MTCDVEQYIPSSDNILNDSVERIVHSEGLVAYPASGGGVRDFRYEIV